jgi:fatty-acyl-CoA synthase
MNGLMMDFQLTIPAMMRRAEKHFGHKEVVSRLPDRRLHRSNYAEVIRRAKRLGLALRRLGIQPGDRVATFGWNHHQHLEAYLGIPSAGMVLHTLNIRLHPNDLTYIANHGGDRAVIVDQGLFPLFEKFRDGIDVQHVICVSEDGAVPEGTLDYEALLAGVDERDYVYPDLDEHQAAAMCYTSGTTGRPKGVLYSHRAIALHSLGAALTDTLGVAEADVVLPVVPLFHANGWGFPFTCTLVGAKQVFPGPYLDPPSLLELFEQERVTISGGVPTIWLGILQALDREPKKYDLSSMRGMAVGGSAAPLAMIKAFQERHGLRVVHAWGMTETTPLGTVGTLPSELRDAPPEEQYAYRARQGRPGAFVEVRARNDQGEVPWDDQTMGELEVRGPWVAAAYYNSPGSEDRFTADGWFKTGDIVTIDPKGCIKIQDRAKDVIKSGGEWISSVELENALMGHPAVAEAAVIGIPDPKWQERPLAVVVLKEGRTAAADELRDYLAPHFAKWWLPDEVVFVDQIPKTAVGKFLKTSLRDRFKDYRAVSDEG